MAQRRTNDSAIPAIRYSITLPTETAPSTLPASPDKTTWAYSHKQACEAFLLDNIKCHCVTHILLYHGSKQITFITPVNMYSFN